MVETMNVLRYPGGKKRMIQFLSEQLSADWREERCHVEPFVGAGAFFFHLRPKKAYLADANRELIDLYRGIRRHPEKVWRTYREYPSTKQGYYEVRKLVHDELSLAARSARTLYLNRTCFKGMWRHNRQGQFNVGYGGQDRRWVVARKKLFAFSRRLRAARISCQDYATTISMCGKTDFLFLDPPYRPGSRELGPDHYHFGRFTFIDHQKLAKCLRAASRRGVRWALTVSSHPSIVRLYRGFRVVPIPRGTGRLVGTSVHHCGEVLISNQRREKS